MRRNRPSPLLVAVILLAACASPPPAAPTATLALPSDDSPDTPRAATRLPASGILDHLAGEPCPDAADFTCVTLSMPLDHFDSSNAATIDVVFAVLPATGERKGLFVTATGGPGASGIAVADSYAESLAPSVRARFDVVFFDQRGVGASGGLQCAAAAAVYYQTDARAQSPEQEAAAVASARAMAQDCIDEMAAPSLLPYLGTRQAVEDLDAFREAIGDEQLWLYGESYGTQFAQTYAQAHPDRLAGLILDGAVDLTLSAAEYLAEQAQAFNDVLVMTLEACDADADCAADMGGDALAAYDALAARLAESPQPYTFPVPSGGAEARVFTLADLEAAVEGYLYAESDRMLLQRAIASAAREDWAPLARILYDSLGLDPESLEAMTDPTYSDAIYYAVECRDYAFFEGAPDERAVAYLRAGDAVDASVPRLSSVFYGDLPCAFWPSSGDVAARPEPLVAPGIPTLVLAATADPATPAANGRRVYERLAEGYLIVTDGGSHVIFGRGNSCPDDIVTAFLVYDTRPFRRETRCGGVVADAYVRLAPADASAFADPLEALMSVDTEISYLPEYFYWDVVDPISIGCPRGGRLTVEPSGEGERLALADCAFAAGFVMTGSGVYDYDLDRFTLEVSIRGLANGQLVYVRRGSGKVNLTGEYAGQTVELSGSFEEDL